MTQTMASRRASLATIAGLATAGSGFTAAATAAPFGNPDAELLALWARYLELMDAGAELYEEDYDTIGDELSEIERRVEGKTARTLEGIAVLLRLGLMEHGMDHLVGRYVYGDRTAPHSVDIHPLLWAALVSIERQTGIPDAHPGSDV